MSCKVEVIGEGRWVKKSVALLTIRRLLAVAVRDVKGRLIAIHPVDVKQPELSSRSTIPSSDPRRFDHQIIAGARAHLHVAVDPTHIMWKKKYQRSHGLLIQYPIADQRSRACTSSKLGKTPKPGHGWADAQESGAELAKP
jgi:hypothetical protein